MSTIPKSNARLHKLITLVFVSATTCTVLFTSSKAFAQLSTPPYLALFPYDVRVRSYPSTYGSEVNAATFHFDSTDLNVTENSSWSATSTRIYYQRVSGSIGGRHLSALGWANLYSSASGGTLCTFSSGGLFYIDLSKCNREDKVAYAALIINELAMSVHPIWLINPDYLKQNVVTHETGHVFGMTHVFPGCSTSIMNLFYNSCTPPEHLTESDKAFINLHY